MKTFLPLILFLYSSIGLALSSPFASSVDGISIPNTHVVAENKSPVLRGMAPKNAAQVDELVDYGITQILIFKNETSSGDIAKEEVLLEGKIATVHKIPFKWKGIRGFKSECLQTLEALRLIKSALNRKNAGLFFHCTVGEDRTGYLAGLYRILFEDAELTDVWRTEMCERGYADGNPKKPFEVVNLVHENLTPLFLKMVALIDAGEISKGKLDDAACDQAPEEFMDAATFTCEN
jgi:hypothetical protein